jgi:hypothetical protein
VTGPPRRIAAVTADTEAAQRALKELCIVAQRMDPGLGSIPAGLAAAE